MRMQVTINNQITTFESPHDSVEDAIKAIAESGKQSKFASELIEKHEKYGDLSPKQQAWIHKLAVDANRPPPADLDLGLSQIASHLEAIPVEGRKRPSVELDASGLSITLTLAGDRSKNPGSVTVTNGKPYGDEDGRYYGRISPDGVVSPARSWTDDIQEAVITFNATGNATGGEEADDLPF